MNKMHKHLLSESELNAEAVRLQHKAYLGDSDAQYALADVFQKGRGVDKNTVHAFFWYKRSAQQGHVAAQFNVWYSYLTGEGVETNLEKSDAWYRVASNNNINSTDVSVVKKMLNVS
ncbi:MAG TPA: sel1 repeat family protein [Candidatus Thioglobus sp.]|jgi:TPR repeat protein|nr:sel1 repeat family protein [Candidatus Thioglobus sp.]